MTHEARAREILPFLISESSYESRMKLLVAALDTSRAEGIIEGAKLAYESIDNAFDAAKAAVTK